MATANELMQVLASSLDEILNGEKKGKARTIGFALMVFEFNKIEAGYMNWVSNAERADMIVALKEIIAQLEGRHHEGSNANN